MSEFVIFFLAALPLTLLAISNWRYAFLAALVAGFVQDPIRKSLDGTPVSMVMFSTFALGFALIGAMRVHGFVNMRPMAGGNARTRTALRIFVIYVLAQSLLAALRFESIMIPAIGALAYLLPVPALWLAYHYVRDARDVGRFLRVYLFLALVAVVGVYLSNAGFESALLEPIGGDRLIFDRVAGIVVSHSGWLRSAEVGAWHAAAAACMCVILAVSFGGTLTKMVTPAVVAFCLYAAILTGRRKVLAVALLFAAFYFMGTYYFRRRSARRGTVIIIMLASLLILGVLIMAPETSSLSPYMARSTTVFSDAWERLSGMGFGSVLTAFDVGGFLGLGTGAGAQGTQHFGAGGAAVVGGASEGGLGRVTAELGLPGLLMVLICSWYVAKQVRKSVAQAAAADPRLLRLTLGMLAFVAANVPVFIGASQIYGDPFVLIILGSMLGFVLAVPRVLNLQRKRLDAETARARQAQASSAPSPATSTRAPSRPKLAIEEWGDERPQP